MEDRLELRSYESNYKVCRDSDWLMLTILVQE